MSPFLLLPGQVGMLEYVDLVTTTIRPQIKAFNKEDMARLLQFVTGT
jgi:hypothetical protein